MGSWGPALFSNDTACDVRGDYREMIEDGVEDAEAMRRVFEQYGEDLDDPDEGPIVWLALAHTQSKLGRLDDEVRRRALQVIEGGEGLERWAEDPELLAVDRPLSTSCEASCWVLNHLVGGFDRPSAKRQTSSLASYSRTTRATAGLLYFESLGSIRTAIRSPRSYELCNSQEPRSQTRSRWQGWRTERKWMRP